MDKRYRINEIFYSLQGEGFYTGTPAVFLRFSGCNRACAFCDTDHSGADELTAAQIVERVSAYPSRHLVATGGEPLLQLDDVLVRGLRGARFYIQVETNGSLPVPTGVDWVTCSPKDAPWQVGHIDELKVVFQGQDVEEIARLLPARHRFLQPCSMLNTAEVVDYILGHPHWRLSLQTHKLINIQ